MAPPSSLPHRPRCPALASGTVGRKKAGASGVRALGVGFWSLRLQGFQGLGLGFKGFNGVFGFRGFGLEGLGF